ncbi:Uncharacterised protein [Actinobacillus equuli]|nr:Uncharacterised protein [Actinobacillus equuli]
MDIWHKLTMGIALFCFSVPAIWGSWIYWAEMLTNTPRTLRFCRDYAVMHIRINIRVNPRVLGQLWAYISLAAGLVLSIVALPFVWIYRKICP